MAAARSTPNCQEKMVVNSAELLTSKNVELGTAVLNTSAAYVAVRSQARDAVPYIQWSLLKVVPTDSLGTVTVNPKEFGLKYLNPQMRVMWTPAEPQVLTKVVLTASPFHFESLSRLGASLLTRLPQFLSAGEFLAGLNCRVRACEPVDQGVLPADLSQLSISVFEDTQPDTANTNHSTTTNTIANGTASDGTISNLANLALDPFLVGEAKQLQVGVSPMARQISLSSLLPVVPPHADAENIAFLKVSSLAKLGCFSGDLVSISTDPTGEKHDIGTGNTSNSNIDTVKRRVVYMYAYPEPSDALVDVVYLTPMLCHNMGAPTSVVLSKVEISDFSFELAREVTLSRISSPISSDKANQAASLRGLKSYFSGVSRVVSNGDLITIPINTGLARLLGGSNGNIGDTDELADLNMLHDDDPHPDQVIWFQVNGLPSDERQYIISPAHTRMVQSGVAQSLAPSSSLNWRSFTGLPVHFNYTNDPKLFAYAYQLQKLLRATLVKQNGSIRTTVLLKSSKRGAGKSSLLTSVAAQLGIHEMTLSAYDLLGDSDSKTLGLLKARLERAATTNNCLVSILHLEALAKKNDVDGKDTPLVNGLVDALEEVLGSDNSIVLAATVSDPDLLAASVRNKFKFEVDVTVPTEKEREVIFQHLLALESSIEASGAGSLAVLPQIDPELITGFRCRGDTPLNSLALQSAGLTPPDLKAIIRNAKQMATKRATKDLVLGNGGIIKLYPEDLDNAIKEARSKFSDSIGAPKIPNVSWKDVGGLDMVKGEILDTIDMPLKHPELFANGLKKRSGILFYGPPGTGKTLLAKAIATNFSLNFFSVKGPELLNMYIGESEANVRRVFQKARDAKPCVVFFDELDSVAPKRGNKGDSGGVMDRIVSQLLAELDGMSEGSDGVFVVGATNRPDLLDEALLRPGRFDKMLYLGVSDTHDKQQTILEALTRKFDLAEEVDLHKVAEMCPFTYTGADFYAMSSDAMLNAMTRTAAEIDAKIAKYNEAHPKAPISIRKWFQSVASQDDIKVRVSHEDFAKAQRELVPSVSAEELQHYLRVRNSFEGTA